MSSYLITYKTLRRLIGILGVAFPFLLLITTPMQESISAFYYTNAQDTVTGVLIAMGIFLLAYHGYNLWDSILCKIAGAMALLAGIFPMTTTEFTHVSIFLVPVKVSSIIHDASSIVLFIILMVIPAFLFTKSDGYKTKQKKIRNAIYISCASVMLVVLIALGIFRFVGMPFWATYWGEALMLIVFGTSWLIKGETLFRD